MKPYYMFFWLPVCTEAALQTVWHMFDIPSNRMLMACLCNVWRSIETFGIHTQWLSSTFSNLTNLAFGCMWILWGQNSSILAQRIKFGLKTKPELKEEILALKHMYLEKAVLALKQVLALNKGHLKITILFYFIWMGFFSMAICFSM